MTRGIGNRQKKVVTPKRVFVRPAPPRPPKPEGRKTGDGRRKSKGRTGSS